MAAAVTPSRRSRASPPRNTTGWLLVYTIASVRADRWLIPAFHAVIDNHIRGGHDDPQNFELTKFTASLERLTGRLRGTGPSASDPAAAQPNPTANVPPAMQKDTAMNADRKDRGETTEANEAMNREFGKDRSDPGRSAEDIKDKAAREANEACRIRRPVP